MTYRQVPLREMLRLGQGLAARDFKEGHWVPASRGRRGSSGGHSALGHVESSGAVGGIWHSLMEIVPRIPKSSSQTLLLGGLTAP